ncbi:MAG: hypothetical protein QOJ57_1587 [Thermoleophilaceae bacterium]|jgi:uncharacterized membrane protein|nr:hypothetical protein [Thermoleophilaceae bacterium]
MPRVDASVAVPGPEEAVLALWFDTRRWPSFVDGLRAVVAVDPDWPRSGRVDWDSTPAGAGRTRETARGDNVVSVEDTTLRGTRAVRYDGDRLHVTLEYELKEAKPVPAFFIRRALRDSLQRTLRRFAVERRADVELL